VTKYPLQAGKIARMIAGPLYGEIVAAGVGADSGRLLGNTANSSEPGETSAGCRAE
jgi:hypothetical protein